MSADPPRPPAAKICHEPSPGRNSENYSEVLVKRSSALLIGMAAAAATSLGDVRYKLPPKEIVQAVDAAPLPEGIASPARDALLLVDYESYPPISMIARPMLRIAGIRIDPAMGARRRVRRATGLSVQRLDGSPARRVALPSGARIGSPVWSRDGRRFAFARDLDDHVELWVGDAARAEARAIPGVRLIDVLGRPFAWARDGRRLLVWTVPAGRGPAPEAARVPSGPVVEESLGKRSQMATFEDLIRDAHDEDAFEYFATSQLSIVDPDSGAVSSLGAPGLYLSAEESPDRNWLLVSRLKRPFSTRVPFYLFSRTTEVWDTSARRVATIADLPVSDEVPRQGVPIGPRAIEWQPLHPATVLWVEALDGGDPMRKVPNRDRLLRFRAPFREVPEPAASIAFRFAGLVWSPRKDVALLSEFDRDRRWDTTRVVDFAEAPSSNSKGKVLFDRSVNDAYNDPGAPVLEFNEDGDRVLVEDGDWVYFAGNGASEEGDRPFLDRRNLATNAKDRLFRCDERGFEPFVAFASSGPGRSAIVTRRESLSDPPNYFVVDWRTGKRRSVTAFADPSPGVSRIRKQLVRYARKDGTPLSGTLYLPPDWKPGTRLPALVWAYPLEYSDAGTAGQVRGSTRTFTRPVGPSPLFFALAGYAVLNDATMPVVGDPETVNNTYLEQIADAARAAVDKLDEMGVADRSRVLIGGHSYGAFMAANLLAHTDLFAAGIARSGAYNRSLTPFGFQTERRSYWEATDLYTKISPFTYANQIKKPILLIHGEADDNSGTFPVQTERLFQAIKGNGGTARMVLLPHEAHAYRARESVLDVLAEMVEWADRWVKTTAAAPKTAAR
jgi:dipeptidyl aminopeptidase/acylaminoacyl peptidase